MWRVNNVDHITHSNLHYLCVDQYFTGKFIQTFTNTTSFESSLEAAADEMVENEDKLAGRYKGK
jgi:hypothetical protein